MKKFTLAVLLFLAACSHTPKPDVEQSEAPRQEVQRDANGRIHRSQTAKNAFKHEHPCPVNGRKSGPCPGYVIDHVRPLACGGQDDPSNMQWQTTEEGKAKDKWELKVYCGK